MGRNIVLYQPASFRQSTMRSPECIRLAALWLLLLCLVAGFSHAQSGHLDLRYAGWGQNQVHRLDSNWVWVPGQWLTAESLETMPEETVRTTPVPGFWNESGEAVSAFGHATLAIRLDLPSDRNLYIQLSDVASAYRLFRGDQLIAQVGTPSVSPAEEEPMFHPVVASLGQVEEPVWLILHISNHHYKQIGVRRSIQITDDSGRLELREVPLLFDIFFCGVLLTLGSLSIARFLRKRNERASLYLGLFSLMVGSRALLVGERIIYQLEWFSWAALQKAEHIILYLGLAAFAAYLYELLDGGMSRRFFNTLWGTSAVLVLLTLFLPVHLGTLTVIPFKVLVLAAALYIILAYWPLLQARGAGVFWFATSFAVLLGTLVVDLVSQNTQFQSRPVVHWGMVLFVVCQGLFLNHVRHWRKQRLTENGPNVDSAPRAKGSFHEMHDEVGISRRKIENLEWQMQQLRDELIASRQAAAFAPSSSGVAISAEPRPSHVPDAETPSPAETQSLSDEGNDDAREALVLLLQKTLGCWERYSGKNKVQLAEESRCWRVYVDGTTVKTRTFDKYLKVNTLPQKPRWRLVIRTAYFVLENGNLPEEEKSALEQDIELTQKWFVS